MAPNILTRVWRVSGHPHHPCSASQLSLLCAHTHVWSTAEVPSALHTHTQCDVASQGVPRLQLPSHQPGDTVAVPLPCTRTLTLTHTHLVALQRCSSLTHPHLGALQRFSSLAHTHLEALWRFSSLAHAHPGALWRCSTHARAHTRPVAAVPPTALSLTLSHTPYCSLAPPPAPPPAL